jgi:hypothetical protein
VDSSYNCNSVGVGPDALTASGTYTLRLTLFSNIATGSATLTVSAPKSLGTVAVNGSPVAMNVNRVGQEVYYTFTATAGERVTETVTGLVTSDGSDCATLTLLTHSGSTVDSSYNCNSVGVGPDTLAKGTYTVRLTLFSDTATGTATLNVSA